MIWGIAGMIVGLFTVAHIVTTLQAYFVRDRWLFPEKASDLLVGRLFVATITGAIATFLFLQGV